MPQNRLLVCSCFPFLEFGPNGRFLILRGGVQPFLFRYFPRIRLSFFRVAAGIFLRSLKMAWARAEPHLQEGSCGMAATVWRTTFAAFSAFLISTATT